MDWDGTERRAPLSDEQMEMLAERAAKKALQKVYAEVGRNVVNKLLYVVGACVVGLLLWMGKKGIDL